jgi:hypothetical protein
MRRVLLATLISVFACGLALARADAPENVTRVYPLENLEPIDAVLLVQASYPGALAPGVEVRPERSPNGGYLRVVAPLAEQEAIARILEEKDVPAPLVTLQVILLDALDASLPAPELPGSAASALKDVRTLFPFKGYRLRHSAVVPANREAQVEMGKEFYLEVQTRADASGTVQVPAFSVTSIAIGGARSRLIGTSFALKRGETVVLGTSLVPATAKLDAETSRALVVLVTALP